MLVSLIYANSLDVPFIFDDSVVRNSKTLEENSGHALAHNNIGVIFQKRGQLKDARYHYTKAVRLDPDYTDARRNLNFISQKIGLSAGH